MAADPTPALVAADRARLQKARSLMQQFGIGGVPSLLRDDGSTVIPVDTTALYRDPLSLLRAMDVV